METYWKWKETMKETMGLAALLSLAVYFLAAGVMISMPWGYHYHYYLLLFAIRLNASMMWCMSALVVVYGKRMFKDEV